MPPGTARFWSWLFAARECREPLLGVYALLAEWRALMDPATPVSVAGVKLAWWREEVERLQAGGALHPISRHLAAQPAAAGADFSPLARALEAAAAQVAGAPVERAPQLLPHCRALHGDPLLLAAQLAGARATRVPAELASCVAALAAGEYLEGAIRDYRRAAHAGRVLFPVDELLDAGIEDADLNAVEAPPNVQSYLAGVRRRAAGFYASAAELLPAAERARQRHLLVLADLGAKRLRSPALRSPVNFGMGDLYAAWSTARRAAAQA